MARQWLPPKPRLRDIEPVVYTTVSMKSDELDKRALKAIGLPVILFLFLFLARVVYTHSWGYWFLGENLALAFLPLGFSWLLVRNLKNRRWLELPNITLSVLWLLFLPNAWYVLTDYVHASPTNQISQLYDIVLITSLVISGFAAGFTSLYLVHRQLIRRLNLKIAALTITGILLLSSFAIYLGRDLRWSSWDVVANPAGITLDVSDRILHPFGHPRSWDMTGVVFLLLVTIYASMWQFLKTDEPKAKRRSN